MNGFINYVTSFIRFRFFNVRISEVCFRGYEARRHYFGYGDSIRIFTGLFEVVTGIVIIVGIWLPILALLGGVMLVVTMIGAIGTHVKIKDRVKNMMMPIVLLVLGAVVIVLQVRV